MILSHATIVSTSTCLQDYPPDAKCKPDAQLGFYYPKDEGLASMAHEEQQHRGRGKRHHGPRMEVTSEARWQDAKEHWSQTAPSRRDALLQRFSIEVCAVISGGRAPALPTLQAALRLCASNVSKSMNTCTHP